MRSIDETIHTDGTSLWSKEVREVRITSLVLNVGSYSNNDDEADEETPSVETLAERLANPEPYVPGSTLMDDPNRTYYGELMVKFDLETWNTDKHGYIYTDDGFIAELKDFLTRAQYDVSDLGYSEQGMQGDDYVSLDVGPKFIASWNKTL